MDRPDQPPDLNLPLIEYWRDPATGKSWRVIGGGWKIMHSTKILWEAPLTLKISPYKTTELDTNLTELVITAARAIQRGEEDNGLMGRVMEYLKVQPTHLRDQYLRTMAAIWRLPREDEVVPLVGHLRDANELSALDESTARAIRDLQAARLHRLRKERPDVAAAMDANLSRAAQEYYEREGPRVANPQPALKMLRDRIFNPKPGR